MGRVPAGTEQFGVRKGAWTEEEDILLRKCIEKFGEGKWRQVPMRAGLKRCRKSCRLRWLNYLKPNLKRGDFEEDEVDLIIRLHKLLGNRWSLIAGRLPGRTANDIKNYWNSYLSKKVSRQTKGVQQIPNSTTTKVIKPQPRTFSPNSKWLLSGNGSVINTQFQPQQIPNETTPQEEETMLWWKSLLGELDKAEEEREEGTWQLRSGEGGLQEEFPRSSAEVQEMEKMEKEKEEDELIVGGGLGEWDNMLLDVNLWALLDQ